MDMLPVAAVVVLLIVCAEILTSAVSLPATRKPCPSTESFF
jgi:hypothetical protein